MHPLRKMTNSYYAIKRLLDRPETPHRTKAVLFDSYISSKWQWCSSVIWPTVRAMKSLEGLKNSLLLGIFRFSRDPFSTWVENVQGCRRALNVYCQTFEGPGWKVAWLTRVWTYLGHLARSREDTPLRNMLHAMSGHKLSIGRLKASWLSETVFHKLRLRYQDFRFPEKMQHWEWQATDRAAWHALLPRWLASWGAADVLPRTTEYLSGRQLVVLDKGVAALRPRRDALDGMYRQGLIHVTQWRANSRTTTTLWVTHTPGQGTACIFCFRAKARVQDSGVIHVRLAGTDGGPEPLRLLLGLYGS